jgi:hypothetical protein
MGTGEGRGTGIGEGNGHWKGRIIQPKLSWNTLT